ncbi:protein-L-isoaspartate O-methyltransferase family protein [Consotaella aegiceratis]|uniref:protein-L-isoaspartate O-methyltransferase family protein n=1 Tax=Consotaella aegiceratis TaxID=3097961 RepID=UPI002F3EAF73
MDFDTARRMMVDNQVRTTDVTDYRVLEALLTVPREEFVPSAKRPLAYIDEDLAVGSGRYLMEPSPFARLLQLANVQDRDVVLDVGCATGYSSAVISQLASSVVALESDADLAAVATDNLSRLDFVNCVVVEGPLQEGYASEAPYDLIMIEGAVQDLPALFFDQLRDGGRLVSVEGIGNAASARLYIKEDGQMSARFGFNCAVKPLPGFERKAEFVFQ